MLAEAVVLFLQLADGPLLPQALPDLLHRLGDHQREEYHREGDGRQHHGVAIFDKVHKSANHFPFEKLLRTRWRKIKALLT